MCSQLTHSTADFQNLLSLLCFRLCFLSPLREMSFYLLNVPLCCSLVVSNVGPKLKQRAKSHKIPIKLMINVVFDDNSTRGFIYFLRHICYSSILTFLFLNILVILTLFVVVSCGDFVLIPFLLISAKFIICQTLETFPCQVFFTFQDPWRQSESASPPILWCVAVQRDTAMDQTLS